MILPSASRTTLGNSRGAGATIPLLEDALCVVVTPLTVVVTVTLEVLPFGPVLLVADTLTLEEPLLLLALTLPLAEALVGVVVALTELLVSSAKAAAQQATMAKANAPKTFFMVTS